MDVGWVLVVECWWLVGWRLVVGWLAVGGRYFGGWWLLVGWRLEVGVDCWMVVDGC